MNTLPQTDPFMQAHADAKRAVATFLPSLTPQPAPAAPTPPPVPPTDALRALSMARHVESMSSRVARGLPAIEPKPTPQHEFGPELDPVHIRALTAAIEAHPETERSKLLHEAHENVTKWVAAHNGRVVVDGKLEIAHTPQSAETLAAKIVNGAVDDHDQRKAEEAELVSGSRENGDSPAGSRSSNVGESSNNGSASAGAVDQHDARKAELLAGNANPEVHSAATGRDDKGTAADVLRAGTGGTPGNGQPESSAGLEASASNQPISAGSADFNTPEIIPPSGDSSDQTQGPPPVVSPQEAQKVGSRKPDGHQVTQPKNSIPANQKLALDAAPELNQALQQLSSQVPGTRFARLRPQKGEDRVEQKVEDQNSPNTLSDYLAAQISAETPQAKDQLVDALRKSFKVIEVDDRFLDGREDKAGYPSANVQVQLSNGMTAEVQIVPREVQDATDASHKFYKAGREAEEKGDTAERDRQWAQAKKIHVAKLGEFKQRNGIADNTSNPSNPSNTPDPHAPLRQSLDAAGLKPIKLGGKLFYALNDQVDSGNGGGDAVPVPVESNGAQGPDLPSAGAGSDEQLSGGISGRLSGSDQSQRPPQKGDPVTLADGTQGQVEFVHPEMNMMRVRTPGGVVVVPKSDGRSA